MQHQMEAEQLELRPRGPAPRPAELLRRTHRLVELVGALEPVSLAQLDAVALQDRVDTKYVFHAGRLCEILPALAEHYAALDIDGLRLSPYQTLYFDTPGLALYLRHHNGRPSRYKVRGRRYVATGRSFLELKLRTSLGRTVKRRVETPQLLTRLSIGDGPLVALGAPLDEALEPRLRNDFTRITLVGRRRSERVTLDLNLGFVDEHAALALPGVVVAEVKQPGRDSASPFVQQMRAAHIRPTSFSKYCVGVALLTPTVKHNAFKEQLRLLHTIMRGAEP